MTDLFATWAETSSIVSGIHALNFSAEARDEVVSISTPFAHGTYRGEPLYDPQTGLALQVEETGLRWPDGSWRQALVHVPEVKLAAGERVTLSDRIAIGGGRPTGFNAVAFAQLARAEIIVRAGSSSANVLRGRGVFLANGPLVKAVMFTARVPGTPLIAEAILTLCTGQPWATLESLQVICYGDVRPQLTYALPDVVVEVRGARIAVRHPQCKIVGQEITEGGLVQRITMATASTWSAGESLLIWGALLLPGEGAASLERGPAQGPIIAISDAWPKSGAYGPLGHVPPLPAGMRAAAEARAQTDYAAHAQGDPWFGPVLGPAKTKPEDPSVDLVAAACTAEAQGVAIERLLAVELSVGQLSCFANHYRDAAGDPIRFSVFTGEGGRPNAVFWCSVPHFTSPTLFGLPTAPNTTGAHGFNCLDDEHAQGAHAIAAAQLLPWRWLRRELDHQLEVQLQCMNTLNAAFSPVVPHLLAARGEARMFRRAWGVAKAIGRADALPWLRRRLDLWHREWQGGTSRGPVTPLKTGADPRRASGQRCWSWEEGEPAGSAAGYVAEYGTTADRELLWRQASSWVRHGLLQSTPVREYEWVVWLGGAAGGEAKVEQGADFLPWGATTLQWVQQEAARRGDTATRQLATNALASLAARPFSWQTFEYQAAATGVLPVAP